MEQLAELREVVAKQGAEIERLKAQRPTTSRTSSKPPSSDPPWQRANVLSAVPLHDPRVHGS